MLGGPGFWVRAAHTQLDNVANNSHDQEAHADGLGNAQELALVGCERKSMLVGLSIFMFLGPMRACVVVEEGEEHVRLVAICLEIKRRYAQ